MHYYIHYLARGEYLRARHEYLKVLWGDDFIAPPYLVFFGRMSVDKSLAKICQAFEQLGINQAIAIAVKS
ncbi:hypothetical protein [Nostoc sp. JL33]|uniref:hypothetical protein n=1 Tax=Nostoc sp. JL33 TaxID=2815396 RepID=UPI0025D9A2D8|nr:hypothetical protein [Nostoc sp. JL33]MBN3869079.1 hypothetical protein [Nostoc sp. JL33]